MGITALAGLYVRSVYLYITGVVVHFITIHIFAIKHKAPAQGRNLRSTNILWNGTLTKLISVEFGYITWLLQLGDVKSDLDY